MSPPNEQDGPTPIAGEPAQTETSKPVPALPGPTDAEQPIQSGSTRRRKILAVLQVLLLVGALGISSYAMYTVATFSEDSANIEPTSELLIRTEGRDADGLCSNGGSLILIGADQNLNQYLDGDEVTSTTTLCHGERGPSGYSGSGTAGDSSLMITAPVDVGNETCIAGGILIQSGIDVNENEALDEDEVQTFNLLCNGPLGLTGSQGGQGMDGTAGVQGGDGAPALVQQKQPPASVCSNGVMIQFGIDDGVGDGVALDGIMHDDEVRSSLNICSQPLFVGAIGDYTTGTTNGITHACDELIWLPDAEVLLTAGSNGADGCELWASDGTADGSAMLLNLHPSGDSLPGRYAGFTLIETDGEERVVFDADDGVNGRQLWVTDGTASGTMRLTSTSITDVTGHVTTMAWNNGLVLLNTPNTMLWTNGTTTIDLLEHESLNQSLTQNDRTTLSELSAFQTNMLESEGGWLWFSAKSTTGIEPYALHTDGRFLAWDLVPGDANVGASIDVDQGRVLVADNGQGRQLVRLGHDGTHQWLTNLMNTNTGAQSNHVGEHLGLHRIGDRIVFDALTSGVDPQLWMHNLTQSTTTLLSTSIGAPGDLVGGIRPSRSGVVRLCCTEHCSGNLLDGRDACWHSN
jgi:ELWxxDGT repeat protein